MDFKYMHPADQLVAMMNRIYQYGMTTTSGGNLSIRDENGDIWITPSGIDKGKLSRADIMQVKPDGAIIGRHKPSIELPIHTYIYRCRPDLNGVLHAHPPALVAFSIARRAPQVKLSPEPFRICGEVPVVSYAVPGEELLGRSIAEKFAEGYNAALMVNHGIVCGGKDFHSAFKRFETIVSAAEAELNAIRLGGAHALDDAQLARAAEVRHLPEAAEAHVPGAAECAARTAMADLAQRCYNQRLFTSVQGDLSMRLEDGSLLVTPCMADRKCLRAGDLVHVENGRVEAGKVPSPFLPLMMQIYHAHPEVRSVIIGQSPAIMGFANAHVEYDSRLTSEGYVIVGDVQRANSLDPEQICGMIGGRKAVVIVDNRCAVITGTSLKGAFDRLEVLEYGAGAAIAAGCLGPQIRLSDGEIDRTVRVLKLK